MVVGGTVENTEIALKLPAIIGRGRSVQVTIPHALVSRHHCELDERQGQLFVRDLGSLNGTYVGDEQITEAALPPGALLTVGTVTFRAVYESTGEGSEGSPSGQQLLTDRSDESTVNGITAIDDDTARLELEELPPDFLPPAALPPAKVKDTTASPARPE
ncbi:MAG: hypothetical protein CMJ64_22310 [Planctomycetaceae bacterium]|nr:hypothetical protein [Planctomycetaceae bacterium]